MNADVAYKWIGADRKGAYGHGDYRAHLPRPSRPGKWTPAVVPRHCVSGWHTTDVEHLWNYWKLDGTLYVAEGRGQSRGGSGKIAWESMRLLRPVGVLTREIVVAFAGDVAEHVVPLFEVRFPNDERPGRAIEAVRRGKVPAEYAAAYAASAAHAAAYAARAANYADYAANAAAGAANAAAHAARAAACAANAGVHATNAAVHAACAANYADYAANAAEYAASGAHAAAAVAGAAERRWAGERLLFLLAR